MNWAAKKREQLHSTLALEVPHLARLVVPSCEAVKAQKLHSDTLSKQRYKHPIEEGMRGLQSSSSSSAISLSEMAADRQSRR